MPTPRAALVALTLLAASASAGAQDADYDNATVEAYTLETAGRPLDAARVLAPFAARFPDDHALALRLGWLLALGSDHRAARAQYARALALSEGESADARLGLAWATMRAGDAAAAVPLFEALLARDPQSASGREGLGLARAAVPPMFRLSAGLWLSGQAYSGHPTRRASFSVTPSLALTVADRVLVGVTYRALGYGYVRSTNDRATQSAWQQELFVTAGWLQRTWSAQLQYGHVWDASNSRVPAHVFGASARLALRGELYAEASVTAYADGVWARVQTSWAARLSDAWSLGPTLSVQAGGSGLGGSVGAALTLRQPRFSLTLAGRYSGETRMTSLNESVTFATDDRIRGALSVSGRVPLGRGLALAPSYEWLRVETTGGAAADAHFFTIGLTGAW